MMVAAPVSPAEDLRIRERLASGTVHFMGISGAGMSALAEAMVRKGGRVTGCDWAPGPAADPLARLGVRVHPSHDPAHLEGVKTLIVTPAVPGDHPEVAEAGRLEIPVIKRARALGA